MMRFLARLSRHRYSLRDLFDLNAASRIAFHGRGESYDERVTATKKGIALVVYT
jgi:hypothetical protein